MMFILYSETNERTVKERLGKPEYSYYFVYRLFRPVFESIGPVEITTGTDEDLKEICERVSRAGETPLLISFSPPNRCPVTDICPVICVFAWEFDCIPDEDLNGDWKENWRTVLLKHGATITLSSYSAEAVRRSTGKHFAVEAIPAPIWSRFSLSEVAQHNPLKKFDMSITGSLVDSRNYRISSDAFEILEPTQCFDIRSWDRKKIAMNFEETGADSAYLGGFYKSEPWGTWSRIATPWILIPYAIVGKVRITLNMCGYGRNCNREVVANFGGEDLTFVVPEHGSDIVELDFNVRSCSSMLRFSNVDVAPIENTPDPRSMGLGIQSLTVESLENDESPAEEFVVEARDFSCEGVVYTSVLNPVDERKNWTDILTAFCMAFHDKSDAVLVLKMTHHSLTSFLGKLHFLLQQMSPFSCRIVVLHGYLEAEEYEKLVDNSTFYVNASKCEGLCLPLMEFMSRATPSIAPNNSAMRDYVDERVSFLVESSVEPAIWPHDTRNVLRALKYRINWESLVGAFRASYTVAKEDPNRYRAMSKAASKRMEAFCADAVVAEKIRSFVNKLPSVSKVID